MNREQNPNAIVSLKASIWVSLICCLVISTGCNLIQATDDKQTAPADTPEDVQFGISRMIERSGAPLEAEKNYRQILAANPKHQQARHRLGVVLLRTERLDESIDQLQQAASLSEPSPDLLGDLGYAYMLSGDLEKSENYLRTAVDKSGDDQRLVNNLGMVVGFLGRDEESLKLFRRVNSESEAQSNLAYVLAGRGERGEAKKRYHAALDREPNLKQAAKGLAEFYRKPLQGNNH